MPGIHLQARLTRVLQLFQVLNSFSVSLLSRTKELERSLDALVSDAEAVDIRVHNAFNEFTLLSDSQFIENVRACCARGCASTARPDPAPIPPAQRVYDHDMDEVEAGAGATNGSAAQAPQPVSEAEIVDRLKGALTLGMEALKFVTLLDADDGQNGAEVPEVCRGAACIAWPAWANST